MTRSKLRGLSHALIQRRASSSNADTSEQAPEDVRGPVTVEVESADSRDCWYSYAQGNRGCRMQVPFSREDVGRGERDCRRLEGMSARKAWLGGRVPSFRGLSLWQRVLEDMAQCRCRDRSNRGSRRSSARSASPEVRRRGKRERDVNPFLSQGPDRVGHALGRATPALRKAPACAAIGKDSGMCGDSMGESGECSSGNRARAEQCDGRYVSWAHGSCEVRLPYL